MTFGCTGCGACCSRVGLNIDKLKSFGFPYETKPNSNKCEKLTDDNKCSVYNNRPDVCNIDTMYYKEYSKLGKTKKEMFKMEATICNKFQVEDGIDESFRVNLEQYK